MYEYENVKRKVYDGGEHGELWFLPICKECSRFVKADTSVYVNGFGQLKDQPNATCSKHGRIKMIFEGYM